MFSWMPGADLNSVVQREIKDLNDTRTGSASRTGAFNWQDHVGAWMAGSDKEEVLRLAKEQANAELTKTLAPRADAAKALLGHLESKYKGVAGKTKEQLDAEIALDERKGAALERTLLNPRVKASDIPKTASVGTILGVGTRATTDHTDKKERKAEDLQMLLLSQQGKRSDDQFAIQMAQQDYQNRALEMKDARLERRDRKDAIQQMMAGLATMGASIAI